MTGLPQGERTRLALLMFERCLTHDAVCERAAISRQTLSSAVNGRRVSLDTWIRIASALGVSVSAVAPPEEAALILAVV